MLNYTAGVFGLLLVASASFGQSVKTEKPVPHKDFRYKVIKKGDSFNENAQQIKVVVKKNNGSVCYKDNSYMKRSNCKSPKTTSKTNSKVIIKHKAKPNIKRTKEVRE